jgi:hypothetical protein
MTDLSVGPFGVQSSLASPLRLAMFPLPTELSVDQKSVAEDFPV